jgi:hypothetical protein
MANRPHLFLSNPRGQKKHFNASRSFTPPKVPDQAPEVYRRQKEKLAHCLTSFNNDLQTRIQERTLELPAHLEYIEIHLFAIFNNNDVFQTKSKFKSYGLSAVIYRNFNQSVIFAITDHEKFQAFVDILQQFINSADNISPKGKSYSIATIIYDFQFLSKEKLGLFVSGDLLLSLVNRNPDIGKEYDNINARLLEHLDTLRRAGTIASFTTDEHSSIEIKQIPRAEADVLIRNFDIIFRIQSLRVPTIRENQFNIPELTWSLTIAPPEGAVVIGVIDNGVRMIAPLENIIVDSNLDITNRNNPDPNQADHPHGTIVASIAAVGPKLFDTNIREFVADAYILPIKILNFSQGNINIYDIEKLIRRAARDGVKIFNLSVCGNTVAYNAVVSEYAYLLDKLAFQYDILIFIAAGNLDEGDVAEMQDAANLVELHQYPNHFFNPNEDSPQHNCEATNICVPAESFNNITVGAIAENFRIDSLTDLTPLKELPAYYTRKHYINPLAKINGTKFQDSQKNRNVNKPDIVMPGGDRLDRDAGMQVFGFGQNGNDFYNFDSGTSLSAPLGANLAAKILGRYGDLNMQTVKAIILNSAKPLTDSSFLDDLELKIKEEESLAVYQLPFASLSKTQKATINPKFSADTMYKALVGFGTPQEQKALHSNEKSVTVLIQDTIPVKTYKVININIPEYLLEYSKDSPVLLLEATLCYKFLPVWGNQLAYNPLHISFNFVNSGESDPNRTAEILSNSKDDYFEQYYEDGMDDDDKRKARKEALGIKSELKSWSEDFYPPANKPFSNVQQLTIQINKNEIVKVGNQISLAVRCTHKTDLDPELLDYLVQESHGFSIVINITEKPNRELGRYDLYDELLACNDLVAAGVLDADNDLNADLDA